MRTTLAYSNIPMRSLGETMNGSCKPTIVVVRTGPVFCNPRQASIGACPRVSRSIGDSENIRKQRYITCHKSKGISMPWNQATFTYAMSTASWTWNVSRPETNPSSMAVLQRTTSKLVTYHQFFGKRIELRRSGSSSIATLLGGKGIPEQPA